MFTLHTYFLLFVGGQILERRTHNSWHFVPMFLHEQSVLVVLTRRVPQWFPLLNRTDKLFCVEKLHYTQPIVTYFEVITSATVHAATQTATAITGPAQLATLLRSCRVGLQRRNRLNIEQLPPFPVGPSRFCLACAFNLRRARHDNSLYKTDNWFRPGFYVWLVITVQFLFSLSTHAMFSPAYISLERGPQLCYQADTFVKLE